MPKQTRSIKLSCRQCNATFKGSLKGNTIVCQSLRQHLKKTKDCHESYQRENLISRRGAVNLHSSVNMDDADSFVAKKRKPTNSPLDIPNPKRVLICDLTPDFLQKQFGAHAPAVCLVKGEAFAIKTTFSRTQNWKPPDSKVMNGLFCNANISFNHFSPNAILLNPKVEDLAFPDPNPQRPPTTVTLTPTNDNDSCALSSLYGQSFGEQEREFDNDGSNEDHANSSDDLLSLESDRNVDDGSMRSHESILPLENNLAENGTNINIATDVGEGEAVEGNLAFGENYPTANQTSANGRVLSLLNRWKNQKKLNTIRPGVPPDPVVVSELSLLQIQHKHGLSLEAVNAVKEWAHSSYKGFPKIFDSRPMKRKKQLKAIRRAMGILSEENFEEIAVDWLPENKKRAIHVRPFMDCVYELLTNEELAGHDGENISLPHPTDPYKSTPDHPPNMASELHHGYWWTETMNELCKENKELLVPIIGYMDGVATDNNGRLPITPLNITLGIFNTETRRKPEAWTTILLYPDDNSEASIQKGTKPFHKLQNLHNCIAIAFRELKELMDGHKSIVWCLKYGGKEWEVYIKFAFAYVIGDTEMHDKLCGR